MRERGRPRYTPRYTFRPSDVDLGKTNEGSFPSLNALQSFICFHFLFCGGFPRVGPPLKTAICSPQILPVPQTPPPYPVIPQSTSSFHNLAVLWALRTSFNSINVLQPFNRPCAISMNTLIFQRQFRSIKFSEQCMFVAIYRPRFWVC